MRWWGLGHIVFINKTIRNVLICKIRCFLIEKLQKAAKNDRLDIFVQVLICFGTMNLFKSE